MNEKFMNALLSFAGKLQTNRVLSAIKDGFIDNMPVVIVGAFCTLLQWVVFHHDEADATVKYLSKVFVTGKCQWSCMAGEPDTYRNDNQLRLYELHGCFCMRSCRYALC